MAMAHQDIEREFWQNLRHKLKVICTKPFDVRKNLCFSCAQPIYHSRTRSLGVLQIPNSSSGSFWLLVILRPSFLRHSGQVKIQLQTHKVLGQALVIAVTKCIYTLYAQFLPLTLTVGERGGFFVDDRQGRNCVFYKVGKAELKRIKLGKLD